MKTKIFIDFDGTLFDTVSFRKEIFKIFESLGLSREDILACNAAESANFNYSALDLARRLQDIKDFSLNTFEKRLDKLFRKSSTFLFPDSVRFLAGIDRSKYFVELLTLGDPTFQKNKVENCGISKYFDNITYVMVQKWEYFQKKGVVKSDEAFVFIDDRSDTISHIRELYPESIALEIDRREEDKLDPSRVSILAGIDQLLFRNDKVIKSLSQAVYYLI